MAQSGLYLCASAAGWRMVLTAEQNVTTDERDRGFVAVREGEDLDSQAVLRLIVEERAAKKVRGFRIVIGVPASWCLCAWVSSEGLPKSSVAQRDQAMAFRLESLLPITAEECAIGLIQGRSGTHRLGIAVQASRLIELVQALENDGHDIHAIVPRGLLAAQAYLEGKTPESCHESMGLLWHESQGIGRPNLAQLLLIDSGQLPRWRVLACRSDALTQQLDIEAGAQMDTRAWKVEEVARTQFEEVSREVAPETLVPSDQAELQMARVILNQHQSPWIDLRVGPLAPRHAWRRLKVPAMACMSAAVVVLLTTIALLWVRSAEYDALARQYDDQSRSAFMQALPGQSVPTSPQRRLQTRLKQLRGEQGLAAGDTELLDQAPLLVLLQEVLTALPTDQRYAITDLRLEDDELQLTGQARSHGEADQLANTLRTRSSFIVEPPSTDSLVKGKVNTASNSATPLVTGVGGNSGGGGGAAATSGGEATSGGGGVRFSIRALYRLATEPAEKPSAPAALAKRDEEARP